MGQWNAYVLAGRSREERQRRLDEVPEHMREQVKRHVMDTFEIRRRQHGR